LAILVSMSRVIIGAHYLSDILAGAYVAVMTVLVLARLRYFRLGRQIRNMSWTVVLLGLTVRFL
ncbi:MAG TPA: phosphatase PAP2 family protein, partial [Syntrophales bacterium]|nr:phosphatase PAP2 family protein [Syntrophales bacterium]